VLNNVEAANRVAVNIDDQKKDEKLGKLLEILSTISANFERYIVGRPKSRKQ